ncbi:MAG: hypothetical protein HQM13_23295 [SAR324 cluster bacterium]|nr:hypothetical protein [SAR324 cluster bacterium]
MNTSNFFPTKINAQFMQIGLNVVGVASGQSWQKFLPGCQSVIVWGSGGTLLWEEFLKDLKQFPQRFSQNSHPLDNYVLRALTRIDPNPPASRRWIRCAADETEFLDFRTLGYQAGLGWESKLGLLLNSDYGPWLGLRLACFTMDSIEPTGPLRDIEPCAGCRAPCVEACPAGAVSKNSRWDVALCASFHQKSTLCDQTCLAREACPEGQPHQYSNLQRHYHYNRESGRAALAEFLNISPEKPGKNLPWNEWVRG